ncbi:MAG: hypothetical protein HRT47_01810 [Candidatus Caenarcaniphilales bacterium]|nr:hypothetical protein [Candidatus Caenarcaniphilales bacterium]
MFSDSYFLELQFENRVYSLNSYEFQKFFEDIMLKKFPGHFQRVRPYGNKGDGGNDGFMKEDGKYFQSYAPLKVNEDKEKEAIQKFRDDFQKLLSSEWGNFSKIKEYYFVYNDKFYGTTIEFEKELHVYQEGYPQIKFYLLGTDQLKSIFKELSEDDYKSLNFNTDKSASHLIVEAYLNNIENQIKLNNVHIAENALDLLDQILNSEELKKNSQYIDLYIKNSVMKYKYFLLKERFQNAIDTLEKLTARYPERCEPLLHLADYYCSQDEINLASSLYEKATTKINFGDYWLNKYVPIYIKIKSNLSFVEDDFVLLRSLNDNQRACFYRLFSMYYLNKDIEKSLEYIDKAIEFDPKNLSFILTKLNIYKAQLVNNYSEKLYRLEFVDNMEKVIIYIDESFSFISVRSKLLLQMNKLCILWCQEKIQSCILLLEGISELLVECDFNKGIDSVICELLTSVVTPDLFEVILDYCLDNKSKQFSDLLLKLIFNHALRDQKLKQQAQVFFESISANQGSKYIKLMSFINSGDEEEFIKIVSADTNFLLMLAETLKINPEFRKKIIFHLRDSNNEYSNILYTIFLFDIGEDKEAFEYLKKIDLRNITVPQYDPLLRVALKNEAWDLAEIIIVQIIDKEENDKYRYFLNTQLLNCYVHLGKHLEATKVGKALLKSEQFNSSDTEKILELLLYSYLKLSQHSNRYKNEVKEIYYSYREYNFSLNFLLNIASFVHAYLGTGDDLVSLIVRSISKLNKNPNPLEYAQIFTVLTLKNQVKIDIESSKKTVTEDSFVKIIEDDDWYYIGNGNCLCAIPLQETQTKYHQLFNASLGDKNIEKIFDLRQFLYYKAREIFNKQIEKDNLDNMKKFNLLDSSGNIDINRFKDTIAELQNSESTFFDKYSENTYPLAMLALFEGGLIPSIAKIQRENKGYIHSSDGSINEIERQSSLIKELIKAKSELYIDTTSILFLSEVGIFNHFINLFSKYKIVQSSINFLSDTLDTYKYRKGTLGTASVINNELVYLPFNKARKKQIQKFEKRLLESIKFLNKDLNRIDSLSKASKSSVPSEQRIPPELCDGAIMAKKNKLPIMTDDYVYLHWNALETNLEPPQYFSSIAFLEYLYEQKIINFEEYLDCFYYFSSYRFRFMSINKQILYKTIFGDDLIVLVNPGNIRKLNLHLILSRDYGVSLQNCFRLIGEFVYDLVKNKSIIFSVLNDVLISLLNYLPLEYKSILSYKMIVDYCTKRYEAEKKERTIIDLKNDFLEKRLSQLQDVCGLTTLLKF